VDRFRFGTRSKYRMLFLWVFIFLVFGCYDNAGINQPVEVDMEPSSVMVRVRWTKPTTGAPVVRYVVQDSIGTRRFRIVSEPSDTFTSVSVAKGVVHVFRVAGVDSQGRQGVWSVYSNPYFIGKHTGRLSVVPAVQIGDE